MLRDTPESVWKPSPCLLDGFHVHLIERQTGPCLRDDYEFARDESGNLLEFRNRKEAEAACARLNDAQSQLFKEAENVC